MANTFLAENSEYGIQRDQNHRVTPMGDPDISGDLGHFLREINMATVLFSWIGYHMALPGVMNTGGSSFYMRRSV